MQSGTHVRGSASGESAAASQPGAAQSGEEFDVGKLFATSCGWCHSGGGREAGKGPRLMGSELSDAELVSRIRNGKVGQMPAFSGAFSGPQLDAIVAYIRNLKPAQQTGAVR